LGLSLLFGESSKRKYDLDQNVVKEYLQLENLRKVCFGLLVNCLICNSSRLLMFLYHADVRVWEVSNKTTGKLVGLWYFDPYARKGNVLELG
jgi:peptidyl-dipeptidase Dcp